MLLEIRDDLSESLGKALDSLDFGGLEGGNLIELNDVEDEEKGELASPVSFQIASEVGDTPGNVAADIVRRQKELGLPDLVVDVTVDGGYINYHIDRPRFSTAVICDLLSDERGPSYDDTAGEKIIADVSSPNIAKPMHVGHLRNTLLSDALTNILESRGHDVITDNHLGDWGVQFGNLMYEYREHGDEEAFEENPIEHLLDLYQQFGEREAELQRQGKEAELKELRDKGRHWFSRLENGDEEAVELWNKFKQASVQRFEETYGQLGVEFDYWNGESFYARNSWNEKVIDKALELGIAVERDDGMIYIPIYPEDLEFVEDPQAASVRESTEAAIEAFEDDGDEADDVRQFVIVKSDGSTLYGTRDLACIEYRTETFSPDRMIYVVGNDQRSFFKEVFVAARKLDHTDVEFEHVNYGLVSLPEGSMSTREGRITTAREVLDYAYSRAKEIVSGSELNLSEAEEETIARKVALATIKFESVSTSREKDITFELEETISFEGDTGPYLQYTETRANSIMENVDRLPGDDLDATNLNRADLQLVFKLARYPLVLEQCEEKYDAAPLANYLLDLAHEFNSFYHTNRVLDAEEIRDDRVLLTESTRRVLENGLKLLGIQTLERM